MKNNQELKDLFEQVQSSQKIIVDHQLNIVRAQGRILNLLYSKLPAQPVAVEEKPINPEEGD